jgi:hypothetical protein
MHLPTRRLDGTFIALEVKVQVMKGVLLDLPRYLSQGFEFRQRVDGVTALLLKSPLGLAHSPPELRVDERCCRALLEFVCAGLHGVNSTAALSIRP